MDTYAQHINDMPLASLQVEYSDLVKLLSRTVDASAVAMLKSRKKLLMQTITNRKSGV